MNKAVDIAQESLRRIGQQIKDPCQAVVMMFVKYCPDASLSAVFRFKVPDKWTAREIQEHLDRYQSELRECRSASARGPRPAKHATVHIEAPELSNTTPISGVAETACAPQINDNCIKTLVNLLDLAVNQNIQIAPKQSPSVQLHARHYSLFPASAY